MNETCPICDGPNCAIDPGSEIFVCDPCKIEMNRDMMGAMERSKQHWADRHPAKSKWNEIREQYPLGVSIEVEGHIPTHGEIAMIDLIATHRGVIHQLLDEIERLGGTNG